jgi:hypothetical protein
MAIALSVPTSALAVGIAASPPDQESVTRWGRYGGRWWPLG